MSVDPNMLDALSKALKYLASEPQRPVPAGVIEVLAPLAKPGASLKINLDASRIIGAPLVTVHSSAVSNSLLAPLTPRQKEVADLVIEGLPNKQIARRLKISVATVKDHVHAILERLNLPSRSAVIAAARNVEQS